MFVFFFYRHSSSSTVWNLGGSRPGVAEWQDWPEQQQSSASLLQHHQGLWGQPGSRPGETHAGLTPATSTIHHHLYQSIKALPWAQLLSGGGPTEECWVHPAACPRLHHHHSARYADEQRPGQQGEPRTGRPEGEVGEWRGGLQKWPGPGFPFLHHIVSNPAPPCQQQPWQQPPSQKPSRPSPRKPPPPRPLRHHLQQWGGEWKQQ